MRTARCSNAFTLLEIMVTLSIAVILFGLAYGSYAASLQSVSACRSKIRAADAADKLLRTIGRDLLGTCIPPSMAAGQSDEAEAFSAGGSTLSFATATARPNAGAPGAGISLVTYRFDAVRGELIRTCRTAGAEDAQVLGRGVHAAVFDCFDGSAWSKQWDWPRVKSIPAAVRVSVTDAAGCTTGITVRTTCETTAKAVHAAMAVSVPRAEDGIHDDDGASR